MPTKIEWASESWNPITGCSPISVGCRNCYAERMAKRLAGRAGYPADDPFSLFFHFNRLEQPLRWRKPKWVFVCSMGDLFHEDVGNLNIDTVIAIILGCYIVSLKHKFIILTKRHDRMKEYFSADPVELVRRWAKAGDGYIHPVTYSRITDAVDELLPERVDEIFPLPNLIGMVTAENQEWAQKRIPVLLETPFRYRGVSIGPMLGMVDVSPWLAGANGDQTFWQCARCGGKSKNKYLTDDDVCNCADYYSQEWWQHSLNWVICEGESGPGKYVQPLHIDWPRKLRDDCQAAGVDFLFKQWGEWALFYDRDVDDPDWRNIPELTANYERWVNLEGGQGFHGERVTAMRRVTKKKAGRFLDGRVWNQFPEVGV